MKTVLGRNADWRSFQASAITIEHDAFTPVSGSAFAGVEVDTWAFIGSSETIFTSHSQREVYNLKKLEERIEKLETFCKHNVCNIQIHRLINFDLNTSLNIIIEPDGEGFIARSPDFPLYGYSNDFIESIEMLKREIESLYEDLIENDDYTEEWLKIKSFLKNILKTK